MKNPRGVTVLLAVDLEPDEAWDGCDSPLLNHDAAGLALRNALDGSIRLLSIAGITGRIRLCRVKDLEETTNG